MQEEVLKYAKESTMISLNYSLSLLKQSVEDFVKEFDNRLDAIQKVGGDLDLSEKQHLIEQKSLLEAVELSDIECKLHNRYSPKRFVPTCPTFKRIGRLG